VVNVQGDEPLIDPALIDAVATLLRERPQASMSTAAHAIDQRRGVHQPERGEGRAATRRQRACTSAARRCPWWRDGSAHGMPPPCPSPAPLRHIGIYGYRAGFLRKFPALPQAPVETARRWSSCARCGTATASRCT
jgi:3-deoxy-manno-octulosonate cytidylyltransferase (CMP-KDO synthetase)